MEGRAALADLIGVDEAEEQYQRGTDDHGGERCGDEQGHERGWMSSAIGDGDVVDQEPRVLGEAPPEHDGCDRHYSSEPGPSGIALGDHHHRERSGDGRNEDLWCTSARQAVEEGRRVGGDDGHSNERNSARERCLLYTSDAADE